MGQEIEYKLRAKDEQELARVYDSLRDRFDSGDERVIGMHTRYFDTPDRFLRGRCWTLRIRQENDRQVLTCKTPGRGRSRGEWSLDRIDESPAPQPGELCALADLGAPEELRTLTGLEAVCGARFTRRCVMLELPDARVELAADVGQLYGKTEREPLCELELELYGGSFSRLSALAALAGLPEEPLSKFARAQRLE
jgi:triphosphatase